ncbi:heterokaryon incompatibility protein-domain-containing protein [Daedaleopsis nitida]|nr:heterokaryon incompatibility protein-domain-containing protein [Daedaleopsis nitida]
MWLLDTHTFQLHFFVSPSAVKEGYVILSHVWDEEEQSFQDLQNIHDRCKKSGENARSLVSPKIRHFCALAVRQGYRWAWIDTCCIDKTSSTELSEAINSMFRYYSLALVCYAYLKDVPAHGDHGTSGSPFRSSRWHTRGWTLQELIAPRIVHFLSSTWEYLGSKADLAPVLRRCTGIPVAVLRLEQRPEDVSVAQRMAWSAKRDTTREEDAAYCLLGLFGINMPTLYGEGKNAFRRLQEEILKNSRDTTLFAWGPFCELDDVVSGANEVSMVHGNRGEPTPHNLLLAQSAWDFVALHNHSPVRLGGPSRALDHVPSSMQGNGAFQDQHFLKSLRGGHDDEVMSLTATPTGLLTRAPVVKIGRQHFVDLSWFTTYTGEKILLALTRHDPKAHSKIPLFTIGCLAKDNRTGQLTPVRMVLVRADRSYRLARGGLWGRRKWKDVRIVHPNPSPPTSHSLYIPPNHTFSPPISLPEHVIMQGLGGENSNYWNVTVSEVPMPWSGLTPISLTFECPGLPGMVAILQYGKCTTGNAYDSEKPPISQPDLFWAKVHVGSRDAADLLTSTHICSQDHITEWPDLRKSFGLVGNHRIPGLISYPWTMTLTFTHLDETAGRLTLKHFAITKHGEPQIPSPLAIFPSENNLRLPADRSSVFGAVRMSTSSHGTVYEDYAKEESLRPLLERGSGRDRGSRMGERVFSILRSSVRRTRTGSLLV